MLQFGMTKICLVLHDRGDLSIAPTKWNKQDRQNVFDDDKTKYDIGSIRPAKRIQSSETLSSTGTIFKTMKLLWINRKVA